MNVTATLETTGAKQTEHIAGFSETEFAQLATAHESPLLRAKREGAYETYSVLPAPTGRTEEWRRTDPSLFPFGRTKSLPVLPDLGPLAEDPWDEHFDVVVGVSDDGYAIKDRGGVCGEGRVRVLSLAEAAVVMPEVVQERLQGQALPPTTDKFAALNQAFWNAAFCVHVPDGIELERGVLFRYDHGRDGTAILPSLLVVLGKGSKANVVERYRSPDDVELLAVTAKEMYVGEGSQLRMFSLQEWGANTYLVDNDMARVERDGTVEWLTLNFGSKVSKMKFGSDVAGPGSSAELDGIFFATGNQHLDQKTLQIHSSPHTYSRLLYKGAVKDRGHSVYQGIIQAKPGAIDVDSYQTNNNLVLNNGAKADTIPGLLIDADDLKCSHGATIGNVDEEQVFYLRSRGLSDHEARKLVIMGYFEEIVDRIPFDFLKDRVHEQIEAKLTGL